MYEGDKSFLLAMDIINSKNTAALRDSWHFTLNSSTYILLNNNKDCNYEYCINYEKFRYDSNRILLLIFNAILFYFFLMMQSIAFIKVYIKYYFICVYILQYRTTESIHYIFN